MRKAKIRNFVVMKLMNFISYAERCAGSFEMPASSETREMIKCAL